MDQSLANWGQSEEAGAYQERLGSLAGEEEGNWVIGGPRASGGGCAEELGTGEQRLRRLRLGWELGSPSAHTNRGEERSGLVALLSLWDRGGVGGGGIASLLRRAIDLRETGGWMGKPGRRRSSGGGREEDGEQHTNRRRAAVARVGGGDSPGWGVGGGREVAMEGVVSRSRTGKRIISAGQVKLYCWALLELAKWVAGPWYYYMLTSPL